MATKQRGGQTNREAHVQMARPDLLLDTSRDRFLAPRIPFSYLTELQLVISGAPITAPKGVDFSVRVCLSASLLHLHSV